MSNLILILEINGKILNKFNEPVQNAYIKCDSLITFSDSLGNFYFNINEPCKIEIKHFLYKDTTFINYSKNPIIILNFKEFQIKEQIVISEKIKSNKIVEPNINDFLIKNTITDVEFNPSGLSISINGIPSKFTNVYIDNNLIIGRTFETIDISSVPLNSIENVKIENLNVYLFTDNNNKIKTFFNTNKGYGFNVAYGKNNLFFNNSFSKENYSYIKVYSMFNKLKFKNFSVIYNYNEKQTPFSENFSDFRTILNLYKLNAQFYRHKYIYNNRIQNLNYEYFISFKNENKFIKDWGFYSFEYGFYFDYIKGNNLMRDVNFLRSNLSFEFYKKFLIKFMFENLEPTIYFDYKNFQLFLISRYPSPKELYMNFVYPELGYKVIGNENLKNERIIGINFRIFSFNLNYSRIFNYIGFVNLGYENNFILYTYENLRELEIYSLSFEKNFHFRDILFQASLFFGKTPIDIPSYKIKTSLNYKNFEFSFWLKDKTQLTPLLYSFDFSYNFIYKKIEFEIKLFDLFDNTSKVYIPYYTGRTIYIKLGWNLVF